MAGPVRDEATMIRGMQPELRPGRFVFATSEDPELVAEALGWFREDEGLSLILPEEVAGAAGLPLEPLLRRIVLGVTSALDGVGLTAAVSGALARYGIPCNVVAALRHDHVFVPEDRARDALAVLERLQRSADE